MEVIIEIIKLHETISDIETHKVLGIPHFQNLTQTSWINSSGLCHLWSDLGRNGW